MALIYTVLLMQLRRIVFFLVFFVSIHPNIIISLAQLQVNRTSTEDLLQAFHQLQLDSLATIYRQNPHVLEQLEKSPGAKTVFAPVSAADLRAPDVDLENTLLYHILNGTYSATSDQSVPYHTIGHSMMTLYPIVNLPGGNGQAVAMNIGRTNQLVTNQGTLAFSFEKSLTVGSYTIYPTIGALTIPGNASFTISSVLNCTSFAYILGLTAQTINTDRGSTLFVPSEEAMHTFFIRHPNMTKEQQESIVKNHVVNVRTLYSPLLKSQDSIITAGGQDMYFDASTNAIAVGNTRATVTQFDIIHSGGVIHLIDSVLDILAEDDVRANAAVKSAQAGSISFVTGPVSATNCASTQGNQVPPSPPTSHTPAKNSSLKGTDVTLGGKYVGGVEGALNIGSSIDLNASDDPRFGRIDEIKKSSKNRGCRVLVQDWLMLFPLLFTIAFLGKVCDV